MSNDQLGQVNPDDPRYRYVKFRNRSISIEQLDAMMALVLDPDKSWWKSILNGFKILVALGFLRVRSHLIDEALQIEKQQYEQDQGDNNQSEIDNEDLDGLK